MSGGRAIGYWRLLAGRECRDYQEIMGGQVLSLAGDQAARVALTVLVWSRTRSPMWTAAAYASSYLPWLAGGTVLAGLADRYPRRRVMIACDVARGGLVAVMSVPGVPLPFLAVLQGTVTLCEAPFDAARSALLVEVIPVRLYGLALSAAQSAAQAAVVAGYVAGGAAAAAAGPRAVLAVDAGTYVVSVVCLGLVRPRPAPAASGERPLTRLRIAARLVWTCPSARTWVLWVWLAAVPAAVAGLAVPLAARLGGGPSAAGMLFAAAPAGSAVSGAVLGRAVGQARRERWVPLMAVGACVALLPCAAGLDLAGVLAWLAIAGACAGYLATASARFTISIAAERRGQAFGLAAAGLYLMQGLGAVGAGAAASVYPVPRVVVIAACTGAGAAMVLAAASVRYRGGHRSGTGPWRTCRQPGCVRPRRMRGGGRPRCAGPGCAVAACAAPGSAASWTSREEGQGGTGTRTPRLGRRSV